MRTENGDHDTGQQLWQRGSIRFMSARVQRSPSSLAGRQLPGLTVTAYPWSQVEALRVEGVAGATSSGDGCGRYSGSMGSTSSTQGYGKGSEPPLSPQPAAGLS